MYQFQERGSMPFTSFLDKNRWTKNLSFFRWGSKGSETLNDLVLETPVLGLPGLLWGSVSSIIRTPAFSSRTLTSDTVKNSFSGQHIWETAEPLEMHNALWHIRSSEKAYSKEVHLTVFNPETYLNTFPFHEPPVTCSGKLLQRLASPFG